MLRAVSVPLAGRVASKRVLKRFQKGPRAWKAQQRAGEAPAPELPPLRFEPTHTPAFTLASNGWTPPPEAGPPADLPFAVERTLKGRSIPVYTDVRHRGSRVDTVVRRVQGDVDALAADLSVVCGGAEVERRAGSLRVPGNHVREVKAWLAGLGF